MKMDKNIFYTFYYYFLINKVVQCERPQTSFSFSFYKTQTHSVRSGMFSTR